MTCDEYRQILLDISWTQDQRREAAVALRHLDQCVDCQRAVEQYEQLQTLLQPGDKTIEPRGGWDAFNDRMLQGAAPMRAAWLPQVMRLAAAFVLGILLVEAMRSITSRHAAPIPPSNNVASASPAFTPQEIAQNAEAFNQVSQVFDRRASWVLLANNTSDVGLSREPLVQQKKLLLVRLTMSHAGAAIANSDLVIIPGQTASLTVPLQNGQSVHYDIGTTAGESTRLSLWAELQGQGGKQALGALATELQVQPNQKVSAGELVTTSGAYQLKVGFSQAPVDGGKL